MHVLIMISCQLSSSGIKYNHPIVCVGRPKQSGQLHTPEFFLAVAGLTTCTVNKVTEPALGNCKTASHRDRQTGSHYLFLSIYCNSTLHENLYGLLHSQNFQ